MWLLINIPQLYYFYEGIIEHIPPSLYWNKTPEPETRVVWNFLEDENQAISICRMSGATCVQLQYITMWVILSKNALTYMHYRPLHRHEHFSVSGFYTIAVKHRFLWPSKGGMMKLSGTQQVLFCDMQNCALGNLEVFF